MRTNAILSYLLLLFHNLRCNENNWIEPHAWSELATETSIPIEDISCQCETPTGKSIASVEDQLALTYFKKFVNALFSTKNLQVSFLSRNCQSSEGDVMLSICCFNSLFTHLHISSMAKRHSNLDDLCYLHCCRLRLMNFKWYKMCEISILCSLKYLNKLKICHCILWMPVIIPIHIKEWDSVRLLRIYSRISYNYSVYLR